ncbi:hypothetical protein Cni_G15859 [Canna indica]|uniref:Uncharacterized protein n=1 Tax=Canna indica TaxID=4628 RepID=A0AAQ3KEI4_9LILI|nr:hypothetical protein Cni_G15859 [Canna indica]
MELNMAQMLSEVESAKCECSRLEEECTEEYISRVKADFGGKWLCGLCAEAVRDEAGKPEGKEEEGVGRGCQGLVFPAVLLLPREDGRLAPQRDAHGHLRSDDT